jgi:hypothetical protein
MVVPKSDDQTPNSTPNLKQPDLHAAIAARLEEANARAYELLAHKRARVGDDAHHPSDDRQTPVDTIHPAVPHGRPSLGRPALRVFVGFLLAAGIVASVAWQSSYGDAAMHRIAGFASQFILTSSQPQEKLELPAQPSPPTIQVDAAKAKVAPLQPAPAAETALAAVAPMPPELAELLETIARDLAIAGQGVEQLKASQEQLARLAKASERKWQRRKSVPAAAGGQAHTASPR